MSGEATATAAAEAAPKPQEPVTETKTEAGAPEQAKEGSVDEPKGDSVVGAEANGAKDASSGKALSQRAQEGRRWNERDRTRHGGKGGSNHKKHTPRNKFDPASLPETDDPVAIRKQVEFYFSDSNLLTDQFLFTKTEGHQNQPVPIDVIHSFKRMRRFQPRSAVVAALRESEFLNLVNDDNDIQRKKPLPEGLIGKPMDEVTKSHEDESMARSVYVKGFGEEEASTQFDIEAFFANYGSTNSVRLRRRNDRNFKGSVFVEFDTEETAKQFLELKEKPSYRGKTLITKSKKQYCDEKVKELESKPKRQRDGGLNRSDGKDKRDWRTRRAEDNARKSRRDDKQGEPVAAAEPKADEKTSTEAAVAVAEAPKETTDAAGQKRSIDEAEEGANGEPAAKRVDRKEA